MMKVQKNFQILVVMCKMDSKSFYKDQLSLTSLGVNALVGILIIWIAALFSAFINSSSFKETWGLLLCRQSS